MAAKRQKQGNLDKFFPSSNHEKEYEVLHTNADDEQQSESVGSTSESSKSMKIKLRKWDNGWLAKFPWLRKSELGGMQCDFCLSSKASNPFTSEEGCTNFQNSTLVRHQECKSHMDSVLKLKLRSQFDIACQNSKRRFHEEGNEKMQNYVKQLRTIYLMAKRYIAADVFSDFMHLQVLNGVKCDSYYKRPQVIMEFEESIETVLEKELLSKINARDYLGIMLDETCDITVEKKLAVYVKFLVNGEANVAFIGNEHITDSTAAGIEMALIEFLTRKGISDEHLSNVYGLGTDGVPVMVMRHNGVGVRLQRRNQYFT